MSFDFHLTSEGLKLIEINTNASHALTVATVLNYLKPNRSQFTNVQTNILKSFTLEHELYFNQQLTRILIADEKPEKQKAYFEFLMYQELFQKMGLECKIADVSDIAYVDNFLVYKDQKFSFVYNRSTDFNFDKTPAFLKSYQDHRVCYTPHPEEYKLLANKNRLIDFRNMNFISQFLNAQEIKHLHSVVPNIEKLSHENFEDIWSRRKKLFFKPAKSFGSKAAYKGENISKKKLLQLLGQQSLLAQEYIPAPELEVEYNGQFLKSKYDLRFYVYNGTIQLVAARLYQGQTTNFQKVGLGICPVLFDY
jgi:glutathione synthase/RimK-type ligase-like ATP-grasp enzyme